MKIDRHLNIVIILIFIIAGVFCLWIGSPLRHQTIQKQPDDYAGQQLVSFIILEYIHQIPRSIER